MGNCLRKKIGPLLQIVPGLRKLFLCRLHNRSLLGLQLLPDLLRQLLLCFVELGLAFLRLTLLGLAFLGLTLLGLTFLGLTFLGLTFLGLTFLGLTLLGLVLLRSQLRFGGIGQVLLAFRQLGGLLGKLGGSIGLVLENLRLRFRVLVDLLFEGRLYLFLSLLDLLIRLGFRSLLLLVVGCLTRNLVLPLRQFVQFSQLLEAAFVLLDGLLNSLQLLNGLLGRLSCLVQLLRASLGSILQRGVLQALP